MGRGITGAVDAALQASNVKPVGFVQLNLDSGTLRLTTHAHDLTWNGFTWYGAGRVGRIEPIMEGADLQMYGVKMTLSGLPVAMISIALQEHVQGRKLYIWNGFFDANNALLADPIGPFGFRIDTLSGAIGGENALTLTAESPMADWERPRIRRYNDADQQAEYPGDLGFQFVEQMQEKELLWGVDK